MKQPNTFVSAMTISACVFFAGRFVTGSGATDGVPTVRPLAKSLGAATVSECRVRCRIEGRTNGVYAVFEFENPTKDAKELGLHYLATRMPPMSMLSRMMPRPETVKKGTVARLVNAGNSTEEILLKEPAPTVPVDSGTVEGPARSNATVSAKSEKGLPPEVWSLIVSREEIKGIHGWGAVGPAATDGTISLDKGEAVLASTIPERKAP